MSYEAVALIEKAVMYCITSKQCVMSQTDLLNIKLEDVPLYYKYKYKTLRSHLYKALIRGYNTKELQRVRVGHDRTYYYGLPSFFNENGTIKEGYNKSSLTNHEIFKISLTGFIGVLKAYGLDEIIVNKDSQFYKDLNNYICNSFEKSIHKAEYQLHTSSLVPIDTYVFHGITIGFMDVNKSGIPYTTTSPKYFMEKLKLTSVGENNEELADKCKAFLADMDRQIDEFRASLRPNVFATIFLEDDDMCIYKGKHLGINIAIPSGTLLAMNEVIKG